MLLDVAVVGQVGTKKKALSHRHVDGLDPAAYCAAAHVADKRLRNVGMRMKQESISL